MPTPTFSCFCYVHETLLIMLLSYLLCLKPGTEKGFIVMIAKKIIIKLVCYIWLDKSHILRENLS